MKTGKRGRNDMGNKTVVFGMLEMGGELLTHVFPDRRIGTLLPIIFDTVKRASVVHTDEHKAYGGLAIYDYWHRTVNHSLEQYVCPKSGAPVYAIEGFWSALQRAIRGTHIHVSSRHLPKYLGEFEYRWNMRHLPHLMLDRLMASFAR